MTSSNIIYYDVLENDKMLFTERHHLLCKKDWSKLFDFYYDRKRNNSLWEIKVVSRGYDDHEAPWENKPISLSLLLRRNYFQQELVKYLESKFLNIHSTDVSAYRFPKWENVRIEDDGEEFIEELSGKTVFSISTEKDYNRIDLFCGPQTSYHSLYDQHHAESYKAVAKVLDGLPGEWEFGASENHHCCENIPTDKFDWLVLTIRRRLINAGAREM